MNGLRNPAVGVLMLHGRFLLEACIKRRSALIYALDRMVIGNLMIRDRIADSR
jgi:hypothetical protein